MTEIHFFLLCLIKKENKTNVLIKKISTINKLYSFYKYIQNYPDTHSKHVEQYIFYVKSQLLECYIVEKMKLHYCPSIYYYILLYLHTVYSQNAVYTISNLKCVIAYIVVKIVNCFIAQLYI